MASDLSSGCTETIDIFDEKEEGEISLEDVSSSEEGGIGHLTCGYVVRSRRSCINCRSTNECASWCTKAYYSKNQSKKDPVKGKENRRHVNEAQCTTVHLSALQGKNDDLVPISSDSDMEIVGIVDASKQMASRSSTKIKKKKKKKDHEYFTVDDLISPSSIDLSISDCFNDSREMSVIKENSLSKTHYRESSPFHRSGKSRMISKSPLRKYKSPVTMRSSLGSSLSPLNRSRLPSIRRSPRRFKPSRQSSSPYRSPIRKAPRKSLRLDTSPSSSTCSYIDRYGDVTRLLKKVKHLDSRDVHALDLGFDKDKEHQPASLKKKLSNMMKEIPDGNGNVTHLKEKSSTQPTIVNDIDEEEDLALLRQKALETKQKNRSIKPESTAKTELERKSNLAMMTKTYDDQDKEDLELRMIALRSAVMKKHQNRIQRGIRGKNKKKALAVTNHSVSPFTQSFLNNIPIPDDEPPCTSPLPSLMDSNHIEDMELDTDIEREKEKLSDSPTNKITADVPIDTKLLGIDPSDVSFINFANADNSPISAAMKNKVKSLSVDVATLHHKSHYEPSPKHFACSLSLHSSNENFHVDLDNDQKDLSNHLKVLPGDSVECDLIDGICCQKNDYSSINMPIYKEIDISMHPFPVAENLPASSISPKDIHVSQQTQNIMACSGDPLTHVQSVSWKELNNIQGNKHIYEVIARYPITDCPVMSVLESTSPNGSMMTIDDLPEIEADLISPVVSTDEHTPSVMNYTLNNELLHQTDGTSLEPSYIQGVPDVTKDINKIPTLINRTLVPASILKSNKQLQQPLSPLKKYEMHLEPTFKSAEMQPVTVTVDENSKNSTTFKPIKLLSFAKKPYSVLTTPVVFDNSINENLKEDTSKSDSHKIAKLKHPAANTTDANNDIPHKKRKRIKKIRRKSHDATASLEDGKDNLYINDVNKDVNMITTTSIPQQQIIESEQKMSNDDNKILQENLIENETSLNLQNIATIQDVSLLTDSSNAKVQNKDNIKRSEQCISLNNFREEHMLSSTNKHQQEMNTCLSPHCLSTNLDISPSSRDAEITEDINNKRQSIDEDEDELRAILLASLAKRTTKSSDRDSPLTDSVTTVTTNCITTNTQQEASHNVVKNILTLATINTTVSNNTLLSSTLDSPKTDKNISNTITTKKIDTISSLDDKRRRSAVITAKGPLKKIVKKTSIPASTKAVNNAKKYQNMIMQRKLNLQKHDTNAHNKAKLKQNNVWSAKVPTKMQTKIHTSETQRIVINLGSDTDSESESEKHVAKTSIPSSNIVHTSTQDTNTDFEKSLHKFLRDMRKEQEIAAASKPISFSQATKKDTPPMIQTNPDEGSSNMHTPLAVRHLPAPQQEEYRRLKQQILEREKLKLQRKVIIKNNTNNNGSNKLLNNMSDSQLKSVLPCDKESTSRQNQVNLKEPERNINLQQLQMGIGMKSIDVAQSTSISNTSYTKIIKNVSQNVTKQINSVHHSNKGAKKVIPNFNIRYTNEISILAEDRAIENLVDSMDKRQAMSDKQQFRPAVRTLSKDEINKKYVQVQLKQDTMDRVVIINDKPLLQMYNNTANISLSEKPVENITSEILETDINKNCNGNNDEFSNASTLVLLNLSNNSSKQEELMDTMETTMSRSQYEREQKSYRNLALFPENSSQNDNNGASCKSNMDMLGDKNNTDDIWNTLRKNVKVELESLVNLSDAEQQQYLSDSEQKLVERRYTILDYLAEMSVALRQWDMEKDLQSNLTIEVKKLKEQLRLAEEKLQEQRHRVSNNNDKISMTRQKINTGRCECFKLSRICSALGNRLIGKDYKLPEAGDQVLSNKLKEVANHTRKLSKKKLLSNDISENSILSTSLLQTSSLSESFNTTYAKNNPQLEEQSANDNVIANNIVGLRNDTSFLEQSNNIENLSTLNTLQSFLSYETPTKKNHITTIISKKEDIAIQDDILPKPRLCSTPLSVKQDSECTQKTHKINISEPIMPIEPILSMTDLSLLEDNEQRNKKRTHLPLLSTTMATMTTTTTTTMMKATIQPYVSILKHLKMPRNANPNGILCPYDLMGICNDGDCRFIHQSTNHT